MAFYVRCSLQTIRSKPSSGVYPCSSAGTRFILYLFQPNISVKTSCSPSGVVSRVVKQCRAMTEELLKLCNYQISDELKAPLSLTKIFPGLARLAPSELIVPLQESMSATLPSESSLESSHKPFPDHLPTIQGQGSTL